jgi:hypothetical protein
MIHTWEEMLNNGFGYGTLIPNPQILMRDPKLPRVPTMPNFPRSWQGCSWRDRLKLKPNVYGNATFIITLLAEGGCGCISSYIILYSYYIPMYGL